MINIQDINWEKVGSLIPAIVQDAVTKSVLMLGYMNQEAILRTQQTQQVTFYSRTKGTLWKKGETSGITLTLVSMQLDCDNDALLITANPTGSICHTGNTTCFGNVLPIPENILFYLENLITTRAQSRPPNSYTTTLLNAGINQIARKVSEEAIEVTIAALNEPLPNLCNEAADLLFHLLVLLKAKNLTLTDVLTVLRKRAKI
jgi:phosphoribosyl-ATP pyrophosphohydrolase/phosphoribosyl-AMP cyclohydrolase